MPTKRTKVVASTSAALAAAVVALTVRFAVPWEGTRLTAYPDVVGVWTICSGHTQGVKAGDTATPDECLAYIQKDSAVAYAAIERCITAELTIGQAIAFTDAVINNGPTVVCGSTLQKLANDGDIDHACLQLVDAKGADGLPTGWTKAGGKVYDGLVRRREAEVILCLKGVQ